MLFFERKSNPILLLPDRFHSVAEFNCICNSAGCELDSANMLIAEKVNDTVIELAGENGVSRWEKILGVSTPLNSSLQARREAVLAKLITKAPINLKVLISIIEAYMGVKAEASVNGWHVNIVYRGTSRVKDLTPLFVTIYNIIPANMTVSISYKYIVWDELDDAMLSFDGLDALNLEWSAWEKGEWLNA